jgi:hypothetical protein
LERTGKPAEALALLGPVNPMLEQVMAALRHECRDGSHLPDQLPPRLHPASSAAPGDTDVWTLELMIEPLLIRATAYEQLNDMEQAFDCAALALNLAPRKPRLRILMSQIYEKLDRPDAAREIRNGGDAASARH